MRETKGEKEREKKNIKREGEKKKDEGKFDISMGGSRKEFETEHRTFSLI